MTSQIVTGQCTDQAAITLREQCGRQWQNELLSFPFTWEKGRYTQANLTLVGRQGPLPTQVSDVLRHTDGSLAGATLWCRISLAADETLALQIAQHESPSSPALSWRPAGEGMLEVSNGLCAARIPATGSYPVTAVPGPVCAVRQGNGEWIGNGTMQASRTVLVTTELLDHGPLFIRWRSSFRYERVTLAAIEGVLYAGEDFLHLRETTSYDSDLTYSFDTSPGLAPDAWMAYGGGERGAQGTVALDYAREETIATVDFNSGHQQMSLPWFGVYRTAGDSCVGVVELNGGAWTNVSTNRVHLVQTPSSLSIISPLHGGYKEWALACMPLAANQWNADTCQPIRLSCIHHRYSGLPLQKVKEWVLEWEPEHEQRPFLQCDAAAISTARERVRTMPELLHAYEALARVIEDGGQTTGTRVSSLTTLWLALDNESYARQAADALEQEIRDTLEIIWREGGLMRLIIFHGRGMKLWLQAYDLLNAFGFIDETRARRVRRDLAFLAYCFADAEFFPKQYNLADLNDPNSFYHGLGQLIGDAICPPNFHTEYFTTYGMMGCCFRTHPQAAAWRQEAIDLLNRQLEVHFYDSGCYCESPNYHAHVFVMINQLALALRRCGAYDFYRHPRFKAQFEYFIQLQTPRVLLNEAARTFIQPWKHLDPDLERYAMIPSNGNTGNDCSDTLMPLEVVLGGVVYQASDPALSARCMETWRRAGRPISNHYDDMTFLLVGDPTLPGTPTLGVRSSLLTGSYVTFRSNAESADEVFVLTKNGTATHHNCFDEGGFTLWAYGAPLASDFGYHAMHNGERFGGTDTWKHNCVEFDGKTSGYLGMEQTLPPEQWVTTDQADLLVSYLPITCFHDPHMAYLKDVVPTAARIEYRRYTLFVKPHYLLVFDSILTCPYLHRWWLHAQAHDVLVEGPQVRFTGKYGVDLLAHFIAPAAPVIASGEWSVMKHISAHQVKAKDWRVFIAPAKPGQEFTVTHEAAGRVVRVATPEYRDTLFLAHHPFTYADTQLTFDGKAAVVREMADGQRVATLLDGTALHVK